MTALPLGDTGTTRTQRRIVAAAALGLLALALGAESLGGLRHALIVPVGALAGLALYHASFGFTSAWRRMLVDARSDGLRAQLAMLAATILVFFPLLAGGRFLGQDVSGFVNPVGPALALGAFLFGIGMQLGGGCGSGTLYTAGGGSLRMIVVLAAFIAGSLIATADPLGWQRWPDYGAHALVRSLDAGPALAIASAALALLYATVTSIEKTRHGSVRALLPLRAGDLLRGPWPLLLGALALALVNVACLVVSGRPWGITAAFALWGAKLAALLGVEVHAWRYWQGDIALSANVLADTTSVMNFALMLGALAAAGLAGRFQPELRVPLASLAAAVIGGSLMGVGARLATGCNIGAFFSGVASGSLHGVLWLVFAQFRLGSRVPGASLPPWLRILERIRCSRSCASHGDATVRSRTREQPAHSTRRESDWTGWPNAAGHRALTRSCLGA